MFARSFRRSFARDLGTAMVLHPVDAFERLEGAEQDAFADACAVAGQVEHVVIAVNEVNVRMPPFAKKRAVARRHPSRRVAGGVTDDIGFCFDDASAEPYMRQ